MKYTAWKSSFVMNSLHCLRSWVNNHWRRDANKCFKRVFIREYSTWYRTKFIFYGFIIYVCLYFLLKEKSISGFIHINVFYFSILRYFDQMRSFHIILFEWPSFTVLNVAYKCLFSSLWRYNEVMWHHNIAMVCHEEIELPSARRSLRISKIVRFHLLVATHTQLLRDYEIWNWTKNERYPNTVSFVRNKIQKNEKTMITLTLICR